MVMAIQQKESVLSLHLDDFDNDYDDEMFTWFNFEWKYFLYCI